MSLVEWVLVLTGVTFHVLVLSAMLRGAVREMPFFFAYVLTILLSTVVETAAALDGGRGKAYRDYYWFSELICRGLLFAALLQMLRRAWQVITPSSNRGGLLALVVMIATAISVGVNKTEPLGQWMTLVSRDLNFASALLNVTLWIALLRVRTDRIALLVVSALGVQMTGAAIGHSLRFLSRSTVMTGNYIIVLSHLLCFFLCWRALRHWKPKQVEPVELPVGDANHELQCGVRR
jgi:hypothetical protein